MTNDHSSFRRLAQLVSQALFKLCYSNGVKIQILNEVCEDCGSLTNVNRQFKILFYFTILIKMKSVDDIEFVCLVLFELTFAPSSEPDSLVKLDLRCSQLLLSWFLFAVSMPIVRYWKQVNLSTLTNCSMLQTPSQPCLTVYTDYCVYELSSIFTSLHIIAVQHVRALFSSNFCESVFNLLHT